jgi:hypothetical protein
MYIKEEPQGTGIISEMELEGWRLSHAAVDASALSECAALR